MSASIPLNPVELWRPKDISNTEIENFRIKVNKKHNINLGTYIGYSKFNVNEL
ncbi:hypothetical protein C1645_759341 [Glomus cerebriforme]|uniref:Uncharacterized protein n=1 Tax=Glomus cerebriforme TaxID=658196 RepID=A0A397TED2_9GLOM|nr:hypothetical protein C1645_759341 [Glomus cerebriforme]